MPPKKICSDKAPLAQREWSVSTCYKRGIKSGFVAGLQSAKKKNIPIRKAVEASAQALVMRKYKSILVRSATNDIRKTFLSLLGVANYRNMSAEQTITELTNRGYTRLMIPRV
jgi:hypothetical protein